MFESLFCKGKFLIRIIDLVRISRDGYMYIKRWFIFRFIIIKNVWMVVYLLYFSFLCVFIIINSCVYNFINVFVIMIFFKCLNKKYILKYLIKLFSKYGIIKCNIVLLIIMCYIF